MCGIVGAVCNRDVFGILIEGLKRLEYRGYDSAGLSLIDANSCLNTQKTIGRVADLEDLFNGEIPNGGLGIAHTRWATHGVPSSANSHPHTSGSISVVHNGIIENHNFLKKELRDRGATLSSETDSEVIAHLIEFYSSETGSLKEAVNKTLSRLEGAYAICVISKDYPDKMIGARSGSPLVIGLGIGEHFMASDQMALRQVTDRFIYLEEGDVAEVSKNEISVFDDNGELVEREINQINESDLLSEKGEYKHFMLKEIFEQPRVIDECLTGRISGSKIMQSVFGHKAHKIFKGTENIHIIACGTSFHSGLIAKYWLEDLSKVSCQVEVASEYRYRNLIVPKNTMFVTISQSGETADTLAAFRKAKDSKNYIGFLAICNVANSTLVRESDLSLMTMAGPEIGVASTKAFTTQLVVLQLLTLSLSLARSSNRSLETKWVTDLKRLPRLAEKILSLDFKIKEMAESFADKNHALFLGRGEHYPVAMEGALKLKEISYIHAEAYPSGELKHGPLALVDENMPVVAIAPSNELFDKLKSNLHEVQARGGELFVFADQDAQFTDMPGISIIEMPSIPSSLEAILYTIPLQLLSYHVACIKGTDVDQPRNLAKSVTVE